VWPPTAALVFHERAKGKFSLDGHIEDFLDFFDLGSHRLEGECHCNLSLNHTLARPLLSGYIDFDNGSYQNYYTGTELKNIRAEWLADKESLFLRVFSAQDAQQQGTLTAKGRIDMAIERKFPFRFDLDFTRLNLASLDLITAQAGGKLQIEGDADGALARGSAAILEADVTVPDRIPRKYPNLQVVYKNAEKPPEPPQALLEEPYPLRLDLSVDAPDGIFISGRGLDTEWKGSFHIGGTQTAVEAKGSIELIKGEFLFSGRRFKLTEGSLSFSGVPNEMPFLNLAGMMEVKDVAITARLKGPLNNPQITLQSTPPLPMGTIMSYLLFGQDMSEINSLQALQLANSLSSIAGEGPDVLETTRRSLGVDRLRLLNLPSDVEGEGGTVAVQVGKYVTEGVIVSYSQGADYSSGNISIEVEAKGGMTFVLESDQVEEQGKFTLRWSHNY
jgi:translocation and assembly module TamB